MFRNRPQLNHRVTTLLQMLEVADRNGDDDDFDEADLDEAGEWRVTEGSVAKEPSKSRLIITFHHRRFPHSHNATDRERGSRHCTAPSFFHDRAVQPRRGPESNVNGQYAKHTVRVRQRERGEESARFPSCWPGSFLLLVNTQCCQFKLMFPPPRLSYILLPCFSLVSVLLLEEANVSRKNDHNEESTRPVPTS